MLKRSRILRKKPKTEAQKLENRIEKEKMWAFFLNIWAERPHYSQVSGGWLGNEIKSWMLDHLLPKSDYPELKYEKDNIILCTFDEHTRKTNGYPDENHKKAIEDARRRFGK